MTKESPVPETLRCPPEHRCMLDWETECVCGATLYAHIGPTGPCPEFRLPEPFMLWPPAVVRQMCADHAASCACPVCNAMYGSVTDREGVPA